MSDTVSREEAKARIKAMAKICRDYGNKFAGLYDANHSLRDADALDLLLAALDDAERISEGVEKLWRYSPDVPEEQRFCFDMIMADDGAYLLRSEVLAAIDAARAGGEG